MDKYEELKLESAKRAEERRELVKRIEKREKIVDIAWHISIWSWIIIWWWVCLKYLFGHINFFLIVLIFSVVCFSVGYIIMRINLWVRNNIGKTVK
jgi:hypothetical protein